ncbi:MAG: F0F1 ATP synthase subunit A [Vampirovibrionales bacterium]
MMSGASHFWTLPLDLPLLGHQVVNLNTLLMVWVGIITVLVFAKMATHQASVYPSRLQLAGEGIVNMVRGVTSSTGHERGDKYLFFSGSVFLFILVANVMGQLPLRLIPLPHGELLAATGDLNTTVALAVLTVAFYFGFGISQKGLGYFKHYFEPLPFMFPMHLMEDITRPGSLALRLFLNIMVGELLSSVALQVAKIGLPCFVIGYELFVAFLQAYIFMLLSSVYIGMMSESHEAHH